MKHFKTYTIPFSDPDAFEEVTEGDLPLTDGDDEFACEDQHDCVDPASHRKGVRCVYCGRDG